MPAYRRVPLSTPADERDRARDLSDALFHLRQAAAKASSAPKTGARIHLAISSALGAIRNAEYRVNRAQRKDA